MKKLRKKSFCALYSPISTWAIVPTKTSTKPSARQTTVSRNDVKILISRSRNIGILYGLKEPGKNIPLTFDDLFVTHQFIKPRLIRLRHDRPDQARFLAGPRVRSSHLYQHRFAT